MDHYLIIGATKKRSNIYPCCGGEVGESKGCSTCKHHIFKLSDPSFLAGFIPFIPIPKDIHPTTLFAAGIDCEMGFTSHGYEMIRLTVVDWETGKTVLDRTVYPYGKVIDLNTRFSGVASLEEGITINGAHFPTLSFKQVRDEMFKLISQSTILIGHGLENDLSVLRLIHTNVVDTSILYPSFNSKRKESLKTLAQMYLRRTIQKGEHDSAEDALAAMDIVKTMIKNSLKRKGTYS